MKKELIRIMVKVLKFFINTSPINLFLWIIGIIFLIYFILRFGHNWWIKRKYKIEKMQGDKRFEIIRDSDSVNDVYIKKLIYHRIADPYTLNELGYTQGMIEKEEKVTNYKVGGVIKIYNIIVELGQIKVLTEKFSDIYNKKKGEAKEEEEAKEEKKKV